MKVASYVAVFIGGAVVCFLLISLGVIDKFDGIPGTQHEPALSLPTYLGFLSVMMTAVTAVLAALAIGIGIIAAYTFRGINDQVNRVALEKVDELTTSKALEERINKILLARSTNPTVAELEESFDPQDDGNR